MIVDLPDTSTSKVAQKLISLSTNGLYSGARVLTLLIHLCEHEDSTRAIEIARITARKFPCRIIIVISGTDSGENCLDAQIRYGGKVGVSEIIIFRLAGPLTHHSGSVVTPFLLPDIPIVAWWPGQGPDNPSTDPIGSLASRRITDTQQSHNYIATLQQRIHNYAPGDTDLAWPRITYIRALLASAVEQNSGQDLIKATVTGPAHQTSIDLFAGWLHGQGKIPVERKIATDFSITLHLTNTSITINVDGTSINIFSTERLMGKVAAIELDDAYYLSEELRRLAPDEIYEIALNGLDNVTLV